MVMVRPFKAIMPRAEFAEKVAALPYDVYSRKEARLEVQGKPYSFLRVDRAETAFEENVNMYDQKVYEKARELLDKMINEGVLYEEEKPCYYIYELIMDGRAQTGFVACASIDDYCNQSIKKHELTREDKEEDRIHHVDACSAQTGPIFLAYRSNEIVNAIINDVKKRAPLFDFVSEDGITHRGWKIDEEKEINILYATFQTIENLYIADGHHRAASAVKVGLKRRKENPHHSGQEEYNYFLSVLFPDCQLQILPYNRAVKDLNGYTIEQFLKRVNEKFEVEENGLSPYEPNEKGTYGMYLEKQWYRLKIKEQYRNEDDPVQSLDVALLQNYLLEPILGIVDPRTDNRIEFIGGIRGVGELVKRVNEDMQIAFSMYPTSIEELFHVADANRLMPPKSTWFEPKLRSGLFIHRF